MKTFPLATGLLLAAVAAPGLAQAADQAADTDDLPQITISDPNRDLFRLGLPSAIGDVWVAWSGRGVSAVTSAPDAAAFEAAFERLSDHVVRLRLIDPEALAYDRVNAIPSVL